MIDVGFDHVPRARLSGSRAWRAVLCLLAVLVMVDELDALEEVHLPLPTPIQGALAAGPYNFQFTGEDHLRLTVFNSLAGVRVAVHYRTAPTPTTTQANRQELAPTSDRVVNTLEWDIGPGYLLNVVAFASSGSPKRGQTFVKLEVIRGFGSSSIVLGCILAGYVTANQPIGWPGSPIESSTDGDGYLRVITGTAPGVGAEGTETVPTGARWELIDYFVIFDSEGAAGLRRPGLYFDDGANPYWRSPSPLTQTNSITCHYYWAQGASYETALLTDVGIAGLPFNNRLLEGHRIKTATNNLKPGDVYHAPQMVAREWLEV